MIKHDGGRTAKAVKAIVSTVADSIFGCREEADRKGASDPAKYCRLHC